MNSTENRFWQKVDRTLGQGPWGTCWLWTGAVNDKGYGKLTVGTHKSYRAHRYSYELANGSLEQGMCALHRCDVRRCVNPDHLFIGTVADNNRDAASKGRSRGSQLKGSEHPQAVLNEKIVERIRLLQRFGLTPGKISRILKLNRSTVKNITHNGYWSHVYSEAA